jgi:hypothetical protein
MNNENLPIYGVSVSKLKDYATSKKDMKRGVEIVPEENYRLKGEDKFTPAQSAGGSAGPSFGQKVGSVGSTAASSFGDSTPSVLGSAEQYGDDYHPEHGFRDSSQTLYAKKGDKKVSL